MNKYHTNFAFYKFMSKTYFQCIILVHETYELQMNFFYTNANIRF